MHLRLYEHGPSGRPTVGALAGLQVCEWLRDALEGDGPGPSATPNMGWVKYGFFYAFRHLRCAMACGVRLGNTAATLAEITGVAEAQSLCEREPPSPKKRSQQAAAGGGRDA
jgi:hypothetical protein